MKYSPQEKRSHYLARSYLNIGRWHSYWHQINEIRKLPNVENILEIGPGNKIISNILKELGYVVKTLDIAEDLNPDYIDNILAPRNVSLNAFDVVLACQVLEHIQYHDFLIALRNLARISRKYLIISLPIYSKFLAKFNIDLPFIRIRRAFHSNCGFPAPHHQFRGGHYWTIGTKEHSLPQVRKAIIQETSMQLINEFRPLEKNNHYFFVLQKHE